MAAGMTATSVSAEPHAPTHSPLTSNRLLPLTLTALGVVYGDIGTSPLYAMRECFFGSHGVRPTHENVLGVLSLIIYALVLVISGKYMLVVMRADNEGEGGILALTALVPGCGHATAARSRLAHGRPILIALGVFGTALFSRRRHDHTAISVLGAIEGLEVATHCSAALLCRLRWSFLCCCSVFKSSGPIVSVDGSGLL